MIRYDYILVFLITCTMPLHAGESAIPDRALSELRDELAGISERESTTEQRRMLKRLVRRCESLLETHQNAPDRFRVLGIAFDTQKELLVLRNDARNRDALLATAALLLQAPYDYAAERLEADVLLMQLALDERGATQFEQGVAVAELADRYRGTPAEVDSLIVASELAFNLGQAELLKALRSTLARKFRESPKAIGFLKDRFNSKSTSLMFRGRFKRVDGQELVFPIDRAGHVYLSCFWSRELHALKARLMEIKALQEKHPGRFEVLSFNLDELPDAGKSTLSALGLDWTPMHLPGGAEHPLFRACGSDAQFLIRMTNAHGYMILTPIGSTYRTFGQLADLDEYVRVTLDPAPLLAMTQSLRIGDFLVNAARLPSGGDLPKEKLKAIQACFAPPPMRYRLSRAESLERYAQADALCDAVIADHPVAKSLWWVYSRQIIARLGLWNQGGEPEFILKATESAEALLKRENRPEGTTVARFCLAKAALREEAADSRRILSEFSDASGGGALATAAAAILTLDAGSPALFEGYREALLDEHLDTPQLYPLTAYLFNKFVVGRLFRGNYFGADVRVYVGFRDWQMNTELRPRVFNMTLETLAGQPLECPSADPEESNVVLFLAPPADDNSASVQRDMVSSLAALAESHMHSNVNFVIAFVDGDREDILALATKNGWRQSQVACVPGGLSNPQLVRLGVFMADQRPNTFIVAHDGTIIWSMSGMYHMAVGVSGVTRTIRDKVEKNDLRIGEAALEKGAYARAMKIYQGSFPANPRAPRAYKNALRLGTARANKGLGQWDDALKDYDAVAFEHAEAACKSPCACHALARKLIARAEIFEALGRDADAAVDRLRAGHLSCPRDGTLRFRPDRYEQEIYNRLEGFRAREDGAAALAYIDDIIVQAKDGRQAERSATASLLREHAETLAQLNNNDKAQAYREWADALTTGIEAGSDTGAEDQQTSKRYVDAVTQ